MSRSDFAPERTALDPGDGHRERVAEIVEESELLTLDTLTERVLEREPGLAATAESRSELHERLYLRDLPALEREDALTFDIERGLVTSGDRASAIATVEAGTPNPPVRDTRSDGRADALDARYYLLATAGAVGLFALAALDAGVFAGISPTFVAVGAVGLFAGMALTDGY